MPEETTAYTLFIAAPSDIINEKELIKKVANKWNRIIGKNLGVRIDVTDWNDAYPLFGRAPQSNINKQLLDKADIIVALFWTKFGDPNDVASSPTEEEILRAHAQKKPLMLYFSDKPIPPSAIKSIQNDRVTEFRERYKNSSLYKLFSNDSEFEDMFLENLNALMNDILKDNLSEDEELEITEISNKLAEEDKKNASIYRDLDEIKSLIEDNFKRYFKELYKVDSSGSVKRSNISMVGVSELANRINDWESRINNDCSHLQRVFDRIDSYSDDEFKNDIFAKELWTVKGALGNKSDRDLDEYRRVFRTTDDIKIKDTVKNIISISLEYSQKPPTNVSKAKIKTPDDFGFDIFTKRETLLTFTIGKGIRSEILYKLHPEFFPLMTRRSIWGLYFLTSRSKEFVVDEEKKGYRRIIHNWEYVYDRFTYYNHLIYLLIDKLLAQYGIKLTTTLKYGYVNSFLVDIWRLHSDEIDELKTLVKID